MSSTALGEGRSRLELPAGPIAYRESGSGRPTLLLHGLLTDGHFWDRVTPLLRGCRVIVPDLPLGSHRLAMNPDADLTPPALARLVADFMAALDLRDVVLAAGDMGGAIAQLVAARHAERLGAFVLTPGDSFDHFFPPTFWYLQALGYLPGSIRAAGPMMAIPGMHRSPMAFGRVQKRPVDGRLARYWLTAAQANPGVRRDLYKVLRGVDRRHTRAAAEELRRFDRPTRLVWADTSKVFPISDGRRLAEMIPGATLTVVPDSYAHVAVDAPEPVARAINEMVGSRT